MTQIPIKFAELHNPLFFNGKSFGTKLDPSQFNMKGMELVYDRENKELLISWNGKKAIIPTSNVVSMEEGIAAPKAQQAHHPQVASIASAQVETPYGHVHAGPGKGKTGK